ncbi:OmpA family protein [Nocardiopsis lucentensis]|uniref:OmpA family protein n=1 Tax=Nocardiopsis lucentensis TaxID=53441 RepID=UPI00037DD8A9|nr:OmpA family protein [Nocardiopsis lucentensis]
MRKPSAILLAAVVLFGVPYALLWHLEWPRLDLTWAGALVHLRGLSVPPGVPTAFLIVLLWTLWGLYLAGIVVEAVARLRGTPGLFRPLGPLQAVAATAVGATVLTPTYALADTVAQEEEGEEAPSDEDGAPPPVPVSDESRAGQSVERERTVAGFATDSAELTDAMREDLAPVVELVREHGDPDVPVRISGHADPRGEDRYNVELSERRARAVADHLAAELGDAAPETVVRGAGSQEPREGDHAAQRRAELVYSVRTDPVPPAQPGAEDTAEPAETVEPTDTADTVAPPEASDTTEPAETIEPAETVQVETMSATSDTGSIPDGAEQDQDENRVVVLEIPDGAVGLSFAFAGVLGGYVLGKRGVRIPGVVLSLPRRLPPSSRSKPLALPPAEPRPTPGDDIDERVSVELGHVPGIGVTGKGAAGAARRLLLNALDDSGEQTARVVITEADTVRLIGEKGRDLLRKHPCEPVRMVGTVERALEELQDELHQRADEALRVDDPAPLVLITAPDTRHETALSSLLLHGQHRGITAVVLGRWPLGGSLTVAEDGLITETSTPLAPLAHHSWPGCDADQVTEAIRAYRHSVPTGGEIPGDGLVPAVPERSEVEEPEEAVEVEEVEKPAEAGGPEKPEKVERIKKPRKPEKADPLTDPTAYSAFWDTGEDEEDDPETNAFWSEVLGDDSLETVDVAEPGASETTVGEDPVPEEATSETGAVGAGAPEKAPATGSVSGRARKRRTIGPRATAGRRGHLSPDQPSPDQPSPTASKPAVPKPVQPKSTAPSVTVSSPARSKPTAPDTRVGSQESGGDGSANRPLPRKPRKAGRGRTWRPKENA